jgi:hypothetical protein
MISTILFWWYLAGWFCVSAVAYAQDELTTGDLVIYFVFAPFILGLAAIVAVWDEVRKDRVIWRKP